MKGLTLDTCTGSSEIRFTVCIIMYTCIIKCLLIFFYYGCRITSPNYMYWVLNFCALVHLMHEFNNKHISLNQLKLPFTTKHILLLRKQQFLCKIPESTHDAYILSSLTVLCQNVYLIWRMEDAYRRDSGYPLKEWLMTPINNTRKGQEERYNAARCKSRNVIERSFSVPKARFR